MIRICTLIKSNLSFSTIDFSSFSHSSVELQGTALTHDNEPLALTS